MKHTPGPWHKEGNGIYDSSPGIPTLLARCTYVAQGNLDLIAAAPDLLAACTLASTYLGLWPVEARTMQARHYAELSQALTQVMAKVEGEQ